MKTKEPNKIIIYSLLGLLTISAFFIRLHNFERIYPDMTIDELVYYRMAHQMTKNFSEYNSIPYGREMHASGRPLPRYFFQPLFKHPPVFTMLITASLKIFGDTADPYDVPIQALYVPFFLSVLMIPLIYWLGCLIADKKVGFLAALFLWLDPVMTISSQKLWMDATVAFFTLLSAFFFVYALKKNKEWFFILSGIAAGLAVNTKYTGILITFAVILFALFYRKKLFQNSSFRISLMLPVFMLIPWFFWNLSIYSLTDVLHHAEVRKIFRLITENTITIGLFVIIVLVILMLVKKRNNVSEQTEKSQSNDHSSDKTESSHTFVRRISYVIVILFFGLLMKKYLLPSLSFTYLPFTTWYSGKFAHEPAYFYFGRLLEFFLVYVFAYLALLLFDPEERPEESFIRISALVILIFFIAWRSFQCRYILSAIPFLLLLASDRIFKIDRQITKIHNALLMPFCRAAFITFILYALAKVVYLNMHLSYPNDMCYF